MTLQTHNALLLIGIVLTMLREGITNANGWPAPFSVYITTDPLLAGLPKESVA